MGLGARGRHEAGPYIIGVRKHILLYGLIGGALIVLLRVIEYRYLVVERSLEIYGGIVAALFAVIGIWLGRKLVRPRTEIIVKEVSVPARSVFVLNEHKLDQLGITRRELEMLELLAAGLSNREIAEKVFLSENTVKTHLSRVFDKLGARRRTQAVQLGKQHGLLP